MQLFCFGAVSTTSIACNILIMLETVLCVTSSAYFKELKYKALSEKFANFADTIYCKSEIQCALTCANSKGCNGISYDKVKKQFSRILKKSRCDGNTGTGNREIHVLWEECEGGWERHFDRCYFLSDRTMTWQNAENDCVSRESHLVTIESECEGQWLNSRLKVSRSGMHVWIGANDIRKEGSWEWISNKEQLVYSDWYLGEPNSFLGDDEDCVDLYWARNLKWNDDICTKQQIYVCEK